MMREFTAEHEYAGSRARRLVKAGQAARAAGEKDALGQVISILLSLAGLCPRRILMEDDWPSVDIRAMLRASLEERRIILKPSNGAEGTSHARNLAPTGRE